MDSFDTFDTFDTFASFTITQPFLGAPLHFNPALGSQELDQLIDAYVPGHACKSDKLSDVTIEFYNNATVDLNTGALVRHYNVFLPQPLWAFDEQSPANTQSSGFSPLVYTPSPASSTTLGDSGYASASTATAFPSRDRTPSARVAKKTKSPAAETRLPGFSIMTKDGVDVTTSAGRGTKTKEQREHAHLMRIMKACAECKRKKIRCDPSHQRAQNDHSRTSVPTSKTQASTSRIPSSRRLDPSPPVLGPSLSFEAIDASQVSMDLFDTSEGIEDFVLFPEDMSSWTPARWPVEQEYDLLNFNFDINELSDHSWKNQDRSSSSSSIEPLSVPSYADQALHHTSNSSSSRNSSSISSSSSSSPSGQLTSILSYTDQKLQRSSRSSSRQLTSTLSYSDQQSHQSSGSSFGQLASILSYTDQQLQQSSRSSSGQLTFTLSYTDQQMERSSRSSSGQLVSTQSYSDQQLHQSSGSSFGQLTSILSYTDQQLHISPLPSNIMLDWRSSNLNDWASSSSFSPSQATNSGIFFVGLLLCGLKSLFRL